MVDKTVKEQAVIVASGGLDSCIVTAFAAMEHNLAMLHGQYGQLTADRELKAFTDIADWFQVNQRMIIPMTHFEQMGGSSLTDSAMDVPVEGVDENIIPNTYVPFRNANLFAAAVSWAEVIGATRIFVGINQMDSSGYPDCSSEFLDAFNAVVKTGTRPETDIQIVAPLLNLNKQEIVELGTRLKAPMQLSWSCYTGSDVACGVCDSCRLRLSGFAQAGIKDPIRYKCRN